MVPLLPFVATLATWMTAGHRAAPAPGATAPQAVDAAQIHEAVFRHLFAHNASAAQGHAGAYCLRVEGAGDPSAALLARFATHRPRVVAGAACVKGSDGVFLRGAGGRARRRPAGLVFTVEQVVVEGDLATASGTYFEDGLSAATYGYTLRRTGAGWEVIERMLWSIS